MRGFDNEMTPLVLDGIMYITGHQSGVGARRDDRPGDLALLAPAHARVCAATPRSGSIAASRCSARGSFSSPTTRISWPSAA